MVFFFNDTATTQIYTLSLHDALPICASRRMASAAPVAGNPRYADPRERRCHGDRKSTRLNSSHPSISYAVFCLKKKRVQVAPSQPSACFGTASIGRRTNHQAEEGSWQ